MITIQPIPRALVPVDSEAAARLSAPNYDEFQDDGEVRDLIREHPECVLRVTMAHCDVIGSGDPLEADSEASLERAAGNMRELVASPLTREVRRALYVYEIRDPGRPGVRQIGLGGMARTADIRTEANPLGPIIRNEEIREAKARGRARLIERTGAIIGTVNCAVPDADDVLAAALEALADARPADSRAVDASGNDHGVWLVTDPARIVRLQRHLSDVPEAYVADGNHRSAAAAMLGLEGFLAVFFPVGRMNILPYNRLVRGLEPDDPAELIPELSLDTDFETGPPPSTGPFQPTETHEIGLYAPGSWVRLQPRPETYDPEDAAESMDHAIVQRRIFRRRLGIEDPGDERIGFVGANRDAAWLQAEVDAGRADLAVTLPAVTMEQLVAVCRQGRMMPPKSTWFDPKIRSGLVMALL